MEKDDAEIFLVQSQLFVSTNMICKQTYNSAPTFCRWCTWPFPCHRWVSQQRWEQSALANPHLFHSYPSEWGVQNVPFWYLQQHFINMYKCLTHAISTHFFGPFLEEDGGFSLGRQVGWFRGCRLGLRYIFCSLSKTSVISNTTTDYYLPGRVAAAVVAGSFSFLALHTTLLHRVYLYTIQWLLTWECLTYSWRMNGACDTW